MKKVILFLMLLYGCASPGYFSLKTDNDLYAPLTKNNDRWYTAGTEFSNTYYDSTGSHTYGVGQLIYNPAHDSITVPQPNDRPYAAYLYGKYTATYVPSFDTEEVYSLAPGIVGPHAYGKETQDFIHKEIGNKFPAGWQYQLNDEPTLEGTYERRSLVIDTSSFNLDRTLGLSVGTPVTQAYVSMFGKIGYNPPAFGQDVIFPRGTKGENPPFRAYFLLGPLVRAVAWNTFLDGNAWQSSASIDKKPIVVEGRVGLGIELEGYTITFTDMIQTAEFDGQSNGAKFAELALGFDF